MLQFSLGCSSFYKHKQWYRCFTSTVSSRVNAMGAFFSACGTPGVPSNPPTPFVVEKSFHFPGGMDGDLDDCDGFSRISTAYRSDDCFFPVLAPLPKSEDKASRMVSYSPCDARTFTKNLEVFIGHCHAGTAKAKDLEVAFEALQSRDWAVTQADMSPPSGANSLDVCDGLARSPISTACSSDDFSFPGGNKASRMVSYSPCDARTFTKNLVVFIGHCHAGTAKAKDLEVAFEALQSRDWAVTQADMSPPSGANSLDVCDGLARSPISTACTGDDSQKLAMALVPLEIWLDVAQFLPVREILRLRCASLSYNQKDLARIAARQEKATRPPCPGAPKPRRFKIKARWEGCYTQKPLAGAKKKTQTMWPLLCPTRKTGRQNLSCFSWFVAGQELENADAWAFADQMFFGVIFGLTESP